MAGDLKHVKIDPEKLKRARGVRKQQDVARVIGISPQRLSNYENGLAKIPDYLLARLCIFYQVRIEDLTNAGKKTLEKYYNAA